MIDAEQWFNKGQLVEVNGFKHFVYDSTFNSEPEKSLNKPVLLILHGYPTCSYDYYKALPYLEQHYRVIIHDHLGFGFSDKPEEYSYSLMEQTDQAMLLWQILGIQKATVLAHDYGTSVATELVARHNRFTSFPLKFNAMVLCNGSMHVEMARLRFIQKALMHKTWGPWVAKLSNRQTLGKNLRQIYFDESLVIPAEIDALWQMMMFNDGRKVITRTTQYIKQRYQYWHRWIGALQTTALPVHIVWAKNDPVAVIAMADTLHQEIANSHLTKLDQLGHFPMLEAPERWAQAVIETLSIELNTQ